jgi:thioredoxin-like negative regulator of GroEL
MLIYVIPFILLLVIAIVLKKREANKQAEQTSTTKVKTKGKKVTATKKTPQKIQIVADPIIEKKKTTALSTEQRNKIELLIQERNFFSAEAQINQALNKDNSQHELYLLLLDLHISQKDEFAINQLINHLRSLELEDILEQALAKKISYQQEIKNTSNTIDIKLKSTLVTPVEQTSTDDFDALMSPSTPAVVENTRSFDQLQQAIPSTEREPVEEIKPLDFDGFSFDKKTVETDKKTLEPTKNETPKAVEDIQPIDFSALSLAPQPELSSQPELPPIEDIQPLDFSFSLDTPVEPPAVSPTITLPAESKQDEIPEFNFNFSDLDALIPTEAKKQEVVDDQPILDFNLDPLSVAEPLLAASSHPNLTPDFEQPIVTTPQVDVSDPLVQSFPELANSNELRVNLELAEQYILLGAFESARELLTEQEAEYTAEQRIQADQLRKQIAS